MVDKYIRVDGSDKFWLCVQVQADKSFLWLEVEDERSPGGSTLVNFTDVVEVKALL